MNGANAHYDGINPETDFTDELKVFTVPTLVMHGDGDQIVPIADSANAKVANLDLLAFTRVQSAGA
jgi:pimeloyl-ACP methyl ester carboxylesterase